jgi:hypothetical protein
MGKYRLKAFEKGHVFGRHTIRIPGKAPRKLKPGEVIECDEALIAPFKYKFEELEPDKATPPPNAKLKIKKRPGGNSTGFDLINPVTGDPINTKPLFKAEVEELVKLSAAEAEAAIKLAENKTESGDMGGDAGTGKESEED